MRNSVDKAEAKMNYAGELMGAAQRDWMTIFAPLQSRGYQWDALTEKLVLPQTKFPAYLTANTPWVHVRGTPTKHCTFDHHIAFDLFGIIPPRCQSCWKVVVTPDTYHQLRQLEELERACPYACKCGIEMRTYTPKHYGGYFYNNSLDEGRECYEWVRQAVNEHIDGGDELSVILKRGCTEFEFLKGPSPFWTMTPEEEKKWELLDSYVTHEKSNARQAPLVQNNIRLRWAQWAHSRGDMTYMPYNGNESLYPDYVKYHAGDIDGIKADLAMATAQVKAGMKGEDSAEFQELAQQFADAKGLPTPTMLIHALGGNEMNPLGNANWAKEIIGEEDQASG